MLFMNNEIILILNLTATFSGRNKNIFFFHIHSSIDNRLFLSRGNREEEIVVKIICVFRNFTMKRAITEGIIAAKDARIIMLDIEGTTTSISFVKEELFPYVRRQVESYLQDTWDDPQTQQDVKALVDQIRKDNEAGVPDSPPCPTEEESTRSEVIPTLVSAVHAMMDADRKIGPLKTLQGHMWRKAYSDGTVQGQ
ncbi:enolase-phosphatase E1 [Palaemon carinicauda]|uniref:enolase-phosphatase E1 n=1 Tax=Palaemon carinicauda TaxID=392227 RepID=UPI0035B66DA5